MTFAAFSYLVGALASLAGIFVAGSRPGHPNLAVLRLLLGGLAAWALWLAVLEAPLLVLRLAPFTPLAESLRYGLLLLVILRLGSSPPVRMMRNLNAAGWSVAMAASIFLPLFMPGSAHLLSRVGLGLSALGLVNLEQLVRNAQPPDRRAIKFLGVALGVLCAIDLFLYSQAELLGGLSPATWAARGLTLAAVVPLIVMGMRHLPRGRGEVFVSRQVVFYTTAFVSIGIYLVAMALGGYYVRRYGGSWGEPLRVLFLVGAGAVLLTLMLADGPWRQLKVFLAKHFFRNKYDYRLEWLRFSRALATRELEAAPGMVVRAVARIFESPGGVLFQRHDADGSLVPAAEWPGVSSASLPAVDARDDLAVFLGEREWVIDVEEYRRSPAVYRNVTLPPWLVDPANRWRILAPLFEKELLVGFIVLQSPPPPFQMTFEDRDLLRAVGRHVSTLLAQQSSDRRLTQGQQFEAYHRLTAFVMHDLKNSVAQLQLVISNAARHRANPEFLDDAISTIGNTVDRMNRLIGQLSGPDTRGDLRPVAVDALLGSAVARAAIRAPAPRMPHIPAGVRVLADADRLGAILEHVLRNAQDAAGRDGEVVASLHATGAEACIEVVDNGPGMTAGFIRDRLFRPFDSTKGARGMGIGAYQTREYVRELGGEVEVQSSPGTGTRFIIRLPRCPTPDPAS